MSARTDTYTLYQQNLQYDKHRLQLNRIKTKSSPIFKRKKEQDSILVNRNYHQIYNSRFKTKQNQDQIQNKNNKIITKMLSLSKIKRPSSNSNSEIRDRMSNSRYSHNKQTIKTIEIENQRFVKKLVTAKPTINNFKQTSSFYDHQRRSQMLSKFRISSMSGGKIPKNWSSVQQRIKLQPLHKKLQLAQSKSNSRLKLNNHSQRMNNSKLHSSQKYSKPLTFNQTKLSKMQYPELKNRRFRQI